MSSTNEKSRVCSPSSYSTGGRPLSRRVQKMAMTPVYGLKMDCRGPNVQEYRSATVGMPICLPHSSTSFSWSTLVNP